MEVDDTSLIRTLLRKGLGFSVLSQGALQNAVDRKELESRPIRPRMAWPLAMMTASGAAALRAARSADEHDPRDGARVDRERRMAGEASRQMTNSSSFCA